MSITITQGYREVGEGPYKWRFPTTFIDATHATEEEIARLDAMAKADAILLEKMRQDLARNLFTDDE